MADVDKLREELKALFLARQGQWFAHPRSELDQDINLLGVEESPEAVDILLRDVLAERPSVVRLRIRKSTIEQLPERFLADNLFVELLEFIEAIGSPGLPEAGEDDVVLEYA